MNDLSYVCVCLCQEWVPIIRHDVLSQRKIKAQPPLSDAYLQGMPAKRRKVGAYYKKSARITINTVCFILKCCWKFSYRQCITEAEEVLYSY